MKHIPAEGIPNDEANDEAEDDNTPLLNFATFTDLWFATVHIGNSNLDVAFEKEEIPQVFMGRVHIGWPIQPVPLREIKFLYRSLDD